MKAGYTEQVAGLLQGHKQDISLEDAVQKQVFLFISIVFYVHFKKGDVLIKL